MPLIMRVSAKGYQEAGLDMFDVSSEGEGLIGAGYQVPLARNIKKASSQCSGSRLDGHALKNAVIDNSCEERHVTKPSLGIRSSNNIKKRNDYFKTVCR